MKLFKLLAVLIPLVTLFMSGCSGEVEKTPKSPTAPAEGEYNPQINPADFTTKVDNKYFTLTPGRILVYEGETEEGTERTEVYTIHETRIVLGVETVVVWDRVWLEGDLIEDTKDWYAQDKEGNVWYFGEDSKELIDGKVVSRAGSWESGVDGAKPGIIMKANPQVGDTYRQEYCKGEAEDQADVLAFGESIQVPYGSFTDCLKTRDWTPLEPDADEYKYYSLAVGDVVLEAGVQSGERVELIEIKSDTEDGQETQPPAEEPEELQTQITEEEAKAIALAKVPGRVTDIDLEKKFGKITYVVEIDADDGPETDVIIDAYTGEILGVET
jgi:uncharacterized membrane protein YkoI